MTPGLSLAGPADTDGEKALRIRMNSLPTSSEGLSEIAFDAAMMDDFPAMVWAARGDGVMCYGNKAALAFTGETTIGAARDGWSDRIHGDDREYCLAALHAAFVQQTPFSVEFRMLRYDGTYRWVVQTGAPMRDAAGEVEIEQEILPQRLLGGEAVPRDHLAQRRQVVFAHEAAFAIRAASRIAAMRLFGLAVPGPAMPSAVPWSGDVRMKGRPRLTLMPPWKSSVFTGMSAWS